jgi:predicted transcriptional regulator
MTLRARDSRKDGEDQIILDLLEAVERNGGQSQRGLAVELNIALGLVNTYLARCIKKGLVKARAAPARRYFYYLTPRGFSQKSRLTVEYLSSSFGFFREAKADCMALLRTLQKLGFTRVVLAGSSDLAEIAALCAAENGAEIVAIVDPVGGRCLGKAVLTSFDALAAPFDAVIVTNLVRTREAGEDAISRFGMERVLVPGLLRRHFQPQFEKMA